MDGFIRPYGCRGWSSVGMGRFSREEPVLASRRNGREADVDASAVCARIGVVIGVAMLSFFSQRHAVMERFYAF